MRASATVAAAAAAVLLGAVFLASGSVAVLATAALCAGCVLAQLIVPADTRRQWPGRLVLPLMASVAGSTAAAGSVLWAALTPAGPVPCTDPDRTGWLLLAAATTAQLIAAWTVLGPLRGARGRVSWWAFLRYTPRLRQSVATVLHVAALAATLAVVASAGVCHVAASRVVDAAAAGTAAAAIAVVDLLLVARLIGVVAAPAGSRQDAVGVELALVAADIAALGQLRVVRTGPDEVLVAAHVGIRPHEDVADTLARARAHIRDFVPAARHIYLRPELPADTEP